MNRKVKIIIIYFLVLSLTVGLVVILFGPIVWWNSLESKTLTVWIVDKTVPIPNYREHKGLTWVLNYNKTINKKTNNFFKYDEDYFGYFPINEDVYEIKNIPSIKEVPDLIYLTDTYGVYTDDYVTPRIKDTQAELIYGGLNDEDIRKVRNNIGEGNTIIGEFNIASAPTNEKNRKDLSDIFGVEWIGWKGRYFKELSKEIEVPMVIVDNYEKQYKQEWKFKGKGFVLISDKDEIIVLEWDKHVEKEGLRIRFGKEYQEEFNITEEIPYQYWFEFLQPKIGRETIASYKLNLTEEGMKVMDKQGLPLVFPAITRYQNSQYTSYYFAGDYSDIENVNWLWRYYGFDKIKKVTSSFDKENPEYFYWNSYVPVMNKILNDINDEKEYKNTKQERSKTLQMVAKAEANGFSVLKDGKWEDIFIKGVNIGVALPGKWFTEFPEDERIYLNWFEKIGEMNANSVRVYTLLPPQFYNALEYYNRTHPEKTLWLFQEIWPEENPKDHNYLLPSYINEYYTEIEHVIDAIHGKANILERKGRAYGVYTSDVSEYVLGYLVGRELEPDEVIQTNEKNKNFSYQGEYLMAGKEASATESWLAMNCDYVMKYEVNTYGWQHPVAIVSWPTLDPIEHDSEWNISGLKDLEYNDKVSVDINNIEVSSNMKVGFFGAYHIYPNYPDFMNNESKYNNYTDEEGRLRYGGYLKEFIDNHTKYAALVAEFGLATGMGNAHMSPDGYNHGGLTEEEQGKGIVRMMKAIQRENYAGGLIFEWMDEWAKKTWTTEPYMIPYERHVFWHNALDPEQNYGILAIEPKNPYKAEHTILGDGEIQKLELKQDAAYLYIDITLNEQPNFVSDRLLLGLDTYDRNRGEFKFQPDIDLKSPSGFEFLLDMSGANNAKILAHPGYNVSNGKFSSYESRNGVFEEIKLLINSSRVTKSGRKIEAIYENRSLLNYGEFKDNSTNHWYIDGNKIHLRIPWGLLNFSDPSQATVLDDNRNIVDLKRDEISTTISEGILLSILMVDAQTKEPLDILNSDNPYLWNPWTEVQYEERLKKSYNIIKEYFGNLK